VAVALMIKQIENKKFARILLHIVLFCGCFAISIKYLTCYLETWVYFPFFPNVFDWLLIMFTVSFLTWEAFKRNNGKTF
jgi:hypothetical protein